MSETLKATPPALPLHSTEAGQQSGSPDDPFEGPSKEPLKDLSARPPAVMPSFAKMMSALKVPLQHFRANELKELKKTLADIQKKQKSAATQ
ncbi:hypothetical protein WR25_02477 [Diploscapter pachys]|uniref:Uncharacterized protein n=1 Tax=Diploscapter pachys TaxID=2018661 RepID=A0A2A2KPL3_9BILA|nr:hypothetical protein WR25_02477 [Diploscapter pachys]